jgi:dTDP-4-amino-4,6-dideoxygalactose transaminase
MTAGAAVRPIYLSAPDVGALEERFLVDALRSGWVAPTGPHLDAFEDEIAARCGRAHAVATSSGTAALHLALLEMGAGPGTVVVVPTLTFAATANAAVYTGATPVFVDCDQETGNIDAHELERCLSTLRRESSPVVAVVTVDLFGRCADYDAILPLCERYGVPVVEDAAEALGSTYRARPAGSFGRVAALSFNGNKILTTSGGGMLLTDDAQLAQRAKYLSTQARQPVDHYEHTEIGYNYRLSNVLAALGRAQLQRLDGMIARRRHVRAVYAELFHDAPGVSILQRAGDEHDNCWLTGIRVQQAATGWSTRDLSAALRAMEIESRPIWKPLHTQPVFAAARAFCSGNAERLFADGLLLPSGSAMTENDVAVVRAAIRGFLEASP